MFLVDIETPTSGHPLDIKYRSSDLVGINDQISLDVVTSLLPMFYVFGWPIIEY